MIIHDNSIWLVILYCGPGRDLHFWGEQGEDFVCILTCMFIILGKGCFVLAPPSIAIPSIGLVFFTVIWRFPWWSGTTRAACASSCAGSWPSLCIDWCLRIPPRSSNNAPLSSFMSKLRDKLCANSYKNNGSYFIFKIYVIYLY